MRTEQRAPRNSAVRRAPVAGRGAVSTSPGGRRLQIRPRGHITSAGVRAMKKRNTKERGAALVEAAIVMPLLLMLTVGIWTTARAWNVHNTMDHAAREAARFGATEVPWDGASPGAVRGAADEVLTASAIAPANVQTVCVGKGFDPCALGATSSTQVAVQLRWPDYRMDFVFFSVPVTLTASAVARYEGS